VIFLFYKHQDQFWGPTSLLSDVYWELYLHGLDQQLKLIFDVPLASRLRVRDIPTLTHITSWHAQGQLPSAYNLSCTNAVHLHYHKYQRPTRGCSTINLTLPPLPPPVSLKLYCTDFFANLVVIQPVMKLMCKAKCNHYVNL
jgi:hypothetical protein